MKLSALICIPAVLLALITGCSENSKQKTEAQTAPAQTTNTSAEVAVFDTSEGQIVVEFWPDTAPKTVENFKKLAKQGFYDGTCFHRIIDGFMVQGGDPLTKDPSKAEAWGTGGPGYQIQGEVSNRPDRHHTRGVISMANSGSPDTAGSQFFICLVDLPQLDGGYTTFGKLIKGDDVLTKLSKSPVQPDLRGEPSRPVNRVALNSVKIVPADSVK